jgi:chromosome segregation ATPase
VDALTQEITRKERTCTTLENQKEALTTQIAQRDKQLLGMKDEAVKERADLLQRYQELKIKIDEKEDELTQRKIDFERERALNQQQIQFTEQKASDLNTQLERTV